MTFRIKHQHGAYSWYTPTGPRVIMAVADGLVPNRRQATSNHRPCWPDFDYTVTWVTLGDIHYVTVITQTICERVGEVGNLLISLLSAGSPSHSDNALCCTNYQNLKISIQCQQQSGSLHRCQGADSIHRCHLTSIGNPIVEIRRSYFLYW